MKEYTYVGLDVHKKVVAYCVKTADGSIVHEGKIPSTRQALCQWAENLEKPWEGGMEATLFTGWIYDTLLPYAAELKVAHPYMLRAIFAAKKKSDKLDARKIADALRADLFPRCHMAPPEIRDLRRVMRHRDFLVGASVKMKNKTSGLLMEAGVEYNKKQLHGKRYFQDLLARMEDVPESVVDMLRTTNDSMLVFEHNQRKLLDALKKHSLLRERIERLMSIPGVGEVTALTWALEIDDPQRFSSVKKAVSYCGLCSGQNQTGGKTFRGPISKQRNKHLQKIIIETAKLAPTWNPQLAHEHKKALDRGANRNEATIAVARKLVAYLLCVDKNNARFELKICT